MLPKNRATRRALRALFIAAAAPTFAHAANDLWNVAANGVWSTPGNWSLGVVPANNDSVFLRDPGVNPITITFDNAALATNLANIWIDSSGTSLVTFAQSLNTLTTSTEIVGSNGAGVLTFNGGTLNVNSALVLGNLAGGSGTMNFSGGTLNVNQFAVGTFGSGVVNQSGGTANIASLQIGQSTNNAVYNQTGGTIVSNNFGEFIGYVGNGTFNQSGGTNNIAFGTQLFIANSAGNVGTYNLSNGASLVNTSFGAAEYIGYAGNGVFNQTGGLHSVVNGTIEIGANGGASGTMTLSGGTLTASSLFVGASGKGTYNQTGGTATISNLVVGNGTGSGSFSLSTGATFINSLSTTVGSGGTGVFTQSGGTFSETNTTQIFLIASTANSTGTVTVSGGSFNIANVITVGNAGRAVFNQSGGVVTAKQVNIGLSGTNSSSYNLSAGAFSATNFLLVGNGGVGNFNQTGGAVTTAQLSLAPSSTNGVGVYTMSATSTLSSSTSENIGDAGSGTFTQNGGSNSTPSLTLGVASSSAGAYALNSGSLNVSTEAVVGSVGQGTFNQTGGTAQITKLSLGSSFNPSFPAGQAQYTLESGATLNVPNGEAIGDAGSGTFNQNGGVHTVGRVLVIGNQSVAGNAGAQNQFNLAGGLLTSPLLEIGLQVSGGFTQTGGTNVVNGNLFIADGTSIFTFPAPVIVANYEQDNGVATISGDEFIGGVGLGTLSLFGGSHSVLDLLLGYVASSSIFAGGTVNMSNATLNVANSEYIGYLGTGNFSQSSGIHTTGTLFVGFNPTGKGQMTLATGSVLHVLGQEIVGVSGSGSFLQSGGLHTVGALLTIQSPTATTSSGQFFLTGGTLTAAVANFGTMTIGGNPTFNGSLTNSGTLILNAFTGNVLASVINQGAVSHNGDFTFAGGFENDAPINAGNHALLFNGLGLNNLSNLTLANTTLGGSGPILNNGQISGFGKLSGTGGVVNNGAFNVTGGALIVADPLTNNGNLAIDANQSLHLSSPLTNAGGITFGAGSFINGAALLTNAPGGFITGPGLIAAPLSNAGSLVIPTGSLNVTQSFVNSGLINLGSVGSGLSGGGVTNTGTMQGLGSVSSPVLNQGTIEAIGGTLSIASVTNTASGLLRVATGNKLLLTATGTSTNTGTVSLVGGTFDTNGKPLVNAGAITGFGTLATGGLTNNPGQTITFTGGLSTINGAVNNSPGGTIRVSYTPAIFTHPVTNSGTIKITSTTVTFAAPFTNNGLYSSDPATTHYTDLTIGRNGALAGGAGDRFFISGDFKSASIQRSTWNTSDGAELHFESGGNDNHLVTLTGSDLGPTATGYHDNFAWGIVSVDAREMLTLADGDGSPGGALYTSILNLPGAPSDASLAPFIAAHLQNADGANPMNVYYDAAQAANVYLHGATYALGNGGVLAPVASVPEPSGLVIACAGGLMLRRRRKSL